MQYNTTEFTYLTNNKSYPMYDLSTDIIDPQGFEKKTIKNEKLAKTKLTFSLKILKLKIPKN